jgi:Arylsulfotransferase (ASST)/Secretion system C-terminal sorting domain/Bacterial Ig-like domain/Kre9/KNH-like N-terminal Ig-like domain
MIKLVLITITLFSLTIDCLAQQIIYTSPRNNSFLVSLQTTIALRANTKIDQRTVQSKFIEINGSKSGNHEGTLKLLDDDVTIIFTPNIGFSQDEDVSVKINEGIKTIEGLYINPLTFQFKTTPLSKPIPINSLSLNEGGPPLLSGIKTSSSVQTIAKKTNTNSLPGNFPTLTVGTSNNPSNEKIFVTNYSFGGDYPNGHYLIIADNNGNIIKYKELSQPSFDFKVDPNGDLSYAEFLTDRGLTDNVEWVVTDTSLTPIATYQCGNGYTANFHDFELLPNGHALLEAWDAEPVDMSKIVEGGNPNATVIGAIIQEVDASHNVIFQWRSWDYIPITDSYENVTGSVVDYLHLNAIEQDKDGNILASFRHLSQVIKINRETGDVMWKLGGKDNQFTFIDEHESNAPNYFSYQHDVRRLPNGDITLFDNGNQHSPPYSRGVEYKVDEQNKTATLVWEYRHNPDIYTSAMGDVQKLPNGNTIIGWGSSDSTGSPLFTEVTPDNSVALEMFFPTGQISYRSYKFPWASQTPAAAVNKDDIQAGNTYSFDSTGVTVTFDSLSGQVSPNASVALYNYSPNNPKFESNDPRLVEEYFNLSGTNINSFNGQIRIDLSKYPKILEPKKIIVYTRTNDSLTFKPLATNYDSTKYQLMIISSSFGDYAFGIPQEVDTVLSPVQLTPMNGVIVHGGEPVQLNWGIRGIVSSCHLQVALDSNFSNLFINKDSLTSTSYTIPSITNNKIYYWRLQTSNQTGVSGWSSHFSFTTASSYISVTYPNGTETLTSDSTYIIRWEDNISDPVSIQLVKDGTPAEIITDNLLSQTNAYKWTVPSNLKTDSSYKIEITSKVDTNISGTSQKSFTINNTTTGVTAKDNLVKTYKLYQNFPNPFNPSTSIEYSVPVESYVKIIVYNMIGQKIKTLVSSIKNAGFHTVNWNADNLSSGIYFYSINATAKNSSKDFYSVKKMILLK